MERRTVVLAGLGLALAVAASSALAVVLVPGGPTLAATWVHEPPPGATGNHHGPAVATVDGRPVVLAPISGEVGSEACRLVALEGGTGEALWRHEVPPAACTVHAIADPMVATWDGRRAVLAATTQRAVVVLDPASGAVRYRYDLASYGYAPPLVADLAPADGEELVVVDAGGTVTVVGADGAVAWRRSLDAHVWTMPVVGDLAADGAPRLAFGTEDGRLLVLRGDGTTALEVAAPLDSSVTWLASGQLDDDPAVELLASTADGTVVAVDAASGAVLWRRSFATFAAVGAVTDGDGDGTAEVYVAAADGAVRALDGTAGQVEWTVQVAEDDVQMMPPPALGDVTGDGLADLVVASNDGRVVALDAATGATLADAPAAGRHFERPTLADLDDDASLEVVVLRASGRVVRYDYDAGGG